MTNDRVQHFAYADDFEMSLPHVIQIASEPTGKLKGQEQVSNYWAQALQRMSNLHFELFNSLIGVNGLSLYFMSLRLGCRSTTF